VFKETASGAWNDLVQTLDDLHSWKVSVLAQHGLTFDLSRGVRLGRQHVQRPSDKKAKKVLGLHAAQEQHPALDVKRVLCFPSGP
jgi:hypothetical protein